MSYSTGEIYWTISELRSGYCKTHLSERNTAPECEVIGLTGCSLQPAAQVVVIGTLGCCCSVAAAPKTLILLAPAMVFG